MSELLETAERFRADLLRRDSAAAAALARAYMVTWRRIEQRLDQLTAQIEQARERGEDITKSWLYEQDRLETIKRQIAAEIAEFIQFAEQRILAEQQASIERAVADAEQLVRLALGNTPTGFSVAWNRLPADALAEFVGFLQDGSPLRTLLDELGVDAGQRFEQALIEAVTLGENPRRTTNRVRDALGGNLTRALRIARQEGIRPYRESTYRSYLNNRHLVRGWIWRAQLSTRTCIVCWAMHGTRHSIDERFASHIACRCAMIPDVVSWDELGYPGHPETPLDIQPGIDAFALLDAAEQQAILGPKKYQAYRAKQITLTDLVGIKNSEKWGRSRYERSLAALTI